jgi:hypothetical protein
MQQEQVKKSYVEPKLVELGAISTITLVARVNSSTPTAFLAPTIA